MKTIRTRPMFRAALLALTAWYGLAAASAGAESARPMAIGDDALVDIFQSGAACVPTPRGIRLWREDAAEERTALLRHNPSGVTARVTWPAGRNRADWPEALPALDGQTYLVQIEGSLRRAQVTLHVMPRSLGTVSHLAVWMAGRGCGRQALHLLGRPLQVDTDMRAKTAFLDTDAFGLGTGAGAGMGDWQ